MKKEKLTPQQKGAVEYTKGPLLIVAGPGAGKTKVLIHKVKYLIKKKKTKASEIVLTTFTIKASEELRKRIQELLPKEDISAMFIGTIHSFCDNIIRQFGGTKGIPLEYSILDEVERYIFLRRYFESIGLNRDRLKLLKKPRSYGETIRDVMRFYDQITENLVDIDQLLGFIQKNRGEVLKNYKIEGNEEEIYNILIILVKSYNEYLKLLNQDKLMDFALLEKNAYSLLQNKQIIDEVQKKIRYVLIDEFQDINPLQWRIFKTIIGSRSDVAVVGDKNQSIYGFRGSNPNIFYKFMSEFKAQKAVSRPLDLNFRSKKDIVDFANYFLRGRDSLHIKPDRIKERAKLYSVSETYEVDSARKILHLIELLYKKKKIKRLGGVALLFRSVKNHGKIFIHLLDTEFRDIPYSVSGGTNFLENPEVRSLVFFLSYTYGIEDEELVERLTGYSDFISALDTSLFRILKKTIEILKGRTELDLANILDADILVRKGVEQKDAQKITKINELRKKNLNGQFESIQSVFYEFLSVTRCFVDYKKNNSLLTRKMMCNIGYFSRIIQHFSNYYKRDDWKGFLYVLKDLPENLEIEGENDSFISDDPEELNLMTVHQAKGLEFPIIIIPSVIGRRFPNVMETRELFKLPSEFYLYEPYDPMKEEENLFYVASTRAQDSLIISKFDKYPSGRSVSNSVFFNKIRHLLQRITLIDAYEVGVKERKERPEGFHVVDYSSISTYIDCPERFNIRYVHGFVAEEIYEQKIGKIYHNAIGKINSHIKEKINLNNDLFKKILDESWVRLKRDDAKDNIMKLKVLKEIKRYYENILTDLKEVKAIEKPLGINFDDVRMRGRLDFLYGDKKKKNVLMDFKSRKLKAIDTTHVDTQLVAYSMALESEGTKVDRIVAYPIQEEKINIKDGELSLKESNKKEVKSLVNKFIKKVKEENFDGSKTQSHFCKACPYRKMCAYNKGG